jgi:hypothetical protein
MALDLFKKNKNVPLVKLVLSPFFDFFKKYIYQKGFLDGYYGLVICIMSAYYKFLKYAKLKDL